MDKKRPWPVKCRSLVSRVLESALRFFDEGKFRFLSHFFKFMFEKGKLRQQYKWVDTSIKEKAKFAEEGLFRLGVSSKSKIKSRRRSLDPEEESNSEESENEVDGNEIFLKIKFIFQILKYK